MSRRLVFVLICVCALLLGSVSFSFYSKMWNINFWARDTDPTPFLYGQLGWDATNDDGCLWMYTEDADTAAKLCTEYNGADDSYGILYLYDEDDAVAITLSGEDGSATVGGALSVTGTTTLGDSVTLSTDKRLFFRDAGQKIFCGTDTYLRYDAEVGHIFGINGTVKLRLLDTALRPETTNSYDLGTSSLLFKDAYFAGTVNAGALAVTNTATLNDDLSVYTNGEATEFEWLEAYWDDTGSGNSDGYIFLKDGDGSNVLGFGALGVSGDQDVMHGAISLYSNGTQTINFGGVTGQITTYADGTTGDIIAAGDVQVDWDQNGTGTFKSADGSSGQTVEVVVEGSDGNNCTLTFKNGILTAEDCP